VEHSSAQLWVRLGFLFLGLFGAGLAISGVFIALPPPAAGGTCGPGQASEAPIAALINPKSIGAGPRPAASNATGVAEWNAFVSECQSSADDRGLAALAILVVSALVAIGGPIIVLRRMRKKPSTVLVSPMERDWRY
jgi:hypothetical protein